MKSLILCTAGRLLFPLILLFSVFLLLRGHSSPGGGFAAGIMAGTAFAFYALAFDVESAWRILRIRPIRLLGIGLLIAAGTGVISMVVGDSYLTGLWSGIRLGGEPGVSLGTPILFDIGIYLVAAGATVLVLLTVMEE